MFLSHVAVGLVGKRFAPRASLGTLLFAALWLDLLWPVLLLLGSERVWIDRGNTAVAPLDFQHYPWSHSLLMTLVWASLIAIGFRAITRERHGANWLFIAVTSHWVLDWISHRPDLPLWPGGPLVGLALWQSVKATVVVEIGMFLVALWIYLRITRPRGWKGRLSLWSLVAVLGIVYFASLRPLPEGTTERVIAMTGLLTWLFIPWAWWIESTRRTVRP